MARRLTVKVPVWRVTFHGQWTLIAATSKRQAQLMAIGLYAERGLTVPTGKFIHTLVNVRLANQRDVDRLRSWWESGSPDADAIIRSIPGLFDATVEDDDADLEPVAVQEALAI